MKQYIKPEITFYDVAPVSILEGSVVINKKMQRKIGVSAFSTDADDWTVEGDSKTYNFCNYSGSFVTFT
ncbi:MAG: hypothetical protein KBT20_10355 [Bacteroidales bacterium]|nr:hypothetical protein [Candidatus Liminaster caballi]